MVDHKRRILWKAGWTHSNSNSQKKIMRAIGNVLDSIWERKNMNLDLMFSSETDLWSTPQKTFDALDQEFHFDCDVCRYD